MIQQRSIRNKKDLHTQEGALKAQIVKAVGACRFKSKECERERRAMRRTGEFVLSRKEKAGEPCKSEVMALAEIRA